MRSVPDSERQRMRLSRFLMLRIAAVSVAMMACALLLALWQARLNIAREERGASETARLFDELDGLESGPAADVPAHLDALRRISVQGRLRHLQLRLQDDRGNDLLPRLPETSTLLQRGVAWLLPPADGGSKPTTPQWNLQRADGRRYRVTLLLDPGSERSESLTDIAGLLGILLGYGALTLLAVYLALRLALRPMRKIVYAIGQYQRDRYDYRLPPLRLLELHTIAQALNHMAQTLSASQDARRRLDLQLRSLREDERSRLARELHDELGQRLTAMRADTAWLIRRSAGDPPLNDVAQALADHCEHVQHALRDLLQRLRARQPYEDENEPLPLHRLLGELVESWRERPDQSTRFELDVAIDEQAIGSDVALTVYRLTQEALTNIARHAQATRVDIRLARLDDGRLEWSVSDDGNGLADPGQAAHRGSGLVGMRERVWALHGEIDMFATHPDSPRTGLTLRARLLLAASSIAARTDMPVADA
jgi:two-component system sensor histidine kinase UhpB